MEWIEVTGRTVDEAIDAALDRLGVQEDEAEFEVLEEPKAGLFGRTRGQARVRARVRPKVPRGKDEKRRRSGRVKQTRDTPATSTDAPVAPMPQGPSRSEGARSESRSGGVPESTGAGGSERPAKDRLPVDVAVTEVTSFLDGLLERLAIDATVAVEVTGEGDLDATVAGSGLGRLIGPRGAMIRAVEELVRTRLQHAADGGSTPKLRLDVGGYRQLRRDTIVAVTDETMQAVRASGTPHVVDVVVAGERKTVHDRVGEASDGLTTRSEGEDPQRRVVILPG